MRAFSLVILACWPLGIQAQSSSPAGTYRVVICKRAPCSVEDTANVVVRGLVVLSDTSYSGAARDTSGAGRGRRDMRSSGCFALEAVKAVTRTFAGIMAADQFQWSSVNDTLTFPLFAASDADHVVTATVNGDALTGVGRSVGRGATQNAPGDDIVAGRRVGAADPRPCVQMMLYARRSMEGATSLRVMRTLPPTIDSTRRWFFHFGDALLDPAAAPGTADVSRAPSNVANAMLVDDAFVVSPLPGATRTTWAYAADAVAQIRALRAAGVPATRIVVVGSGRATDIAVAIARNLSDDIRYVFVGGCEMTVILDDRPRRTIFAAAPATVPPIFRCEARFTAASGSATMQLSTGFAAQRGDGYEEWLNVVRDWMVARTAPP
jgi:hypothetical protein